MLIVKTNKAHGHELTIIAGDQATYELMSAIQKKDHEFDKVILGFHLSFNYLHAICKIMHDAMYDTNYSFPW